MRNSKAPVYHSDGGEYGDGNGVGPCSIFCAVCGETKSPGGNIELGVWLQADWSQDISQVTDCSWHHRRLACLGRCWIAAFGINPSSMTDRQFPVRDGKIKSAFLEPVTAVLSISEGLDADVTSMAFGEL